MQVSGIEWLWEKIPEIWRSSLRQAGAAVPLTNDCMLAPTVCMHSHHHRASCCLYQIAAEQVWAALSRHGGMGVRGSHWHSLAVMVLNHVTPFTDRFTERGYPNCQIATSTSNSALQYGALRHLRPCRFAEDDLLVAPGLELLADAAPHLQPNGFLHNVKLFHSRAFPSLSECLG